MMSAAIPEEFAPAKVNLTLHVTGRRADGYHLLDSLVVFADIGDTISVEDATETRLTITGPMAGGVPVDGSNLVLRAAGLLRRDAPRPARLRLHKRLPHAAGIGGGSSDAAATLRLLARHWGLDLPSADKVLALGADVPVCLTAPRPGRLRGIGERIEAVAALPPCAMILANPGAAVPTGAVFNGLVSVNNPPMPDVPAGLDLRALAQWLGHCRNDLQAPAESLAPEISHCLAALRGRREVLHAAMSGSGATCYGLTASLAEAEGAAEALRAARPGWWIVAARVLS